MTGADPATDKLLTTLKARAEALGFDVFGIADPGDLTEAGAHLETALKQGFHAGMDWMADTAGRRRHPKALWADVRSIIMLGMSYGPDHNPLDDLAGKDRGNISVYARNRDYHDIIKGKLKELAGVLARQSGAEVKVFVDTAPVMEKPLAELAGLGWQGKHTVLVSPDFGSWLFLGAIFTSAKLPASAAHREQCGTCRRCLDICPTNAFPAPFQLDAGKCLAYYSVEHKGHIPRAYRAPMGNRVYGCDDCLAVCPWNKFAGETHVAGLKARFDLAAPTLADLLALDDKGFRSLFSGSPVKRIGHARFLRNALICAGNAGDLNLMPDIAARLRDNSPLVRAASIWGLRRIDQINHGAGQGELDALRETHLKKETDQAVIEEWSGPVTPPLPEGPKA